MMRFVPGRSAAVTRTHGIAAFAVDAHGARSREVEPGRRLRGASVVKPLLFWAGAAARLTARPPDDASRAASAAARGRDEQIVAAHDEFLGSAVRTGTERGLQIAVAL